MCLDNVLVCPGNVLICPVNVLIFLDNIRIHLHNIVDTTHTLDLWISTFSRQISALVEQISIYSTLAGHCANWQNRLVHYQDRIIECLDTCFLVTLCVCAYYAIDHIFSGHVYTNFASSPEPPGCGILSQSALHSHPTAQPRSMLHRHCQGTHLQRTHCHFCFQRSKQVRKGLFCSLIIQ